MAASPDCQAPPTELYVAVADTKVLRAERPFWAETALEVVKKAQSSL